MTTIRFQRTQTIDIKAGDDIACGEIKSSDWKQVRVRATKVERKKRGDTISGTVSATAVTVLVPPPLTMRPAPNQMATIWRCRRG